IKSSPDAVADFNKGKANALKFLLGAVMRETKGRVDPQTIEKMLKDALNKDA
ncbi:MAG TPA: Asp-tRNA(Asn)/Glu-tRNA(Gln) amidotransferase GatCAB subunit B, partial [Candidatus Jacksonbacteria bacterium]